MSESTGDPVLDYVLNLIGLAQTAGCDTTIPNPHELYLKMSVVGVHWMIIMSRREDLLRKGIEPPEIPQEVIISSFGKSKKD